MKIYDKLKEKDITHVDVGYTKYKLLFVDNIPGDDVWGDTDTSRYEIRIVKQNDHSVTETLLHEILHAAFEMSGFTSDDEEQKFAETNEDLVIKIGRIFMMLMRLNKDLMEIILNDISENR